MKAKSILRIVLFILTLWTCGFNASAQVEYQPEMEKFLGDWIHPRTNKDEEYFVRITKQGEFVSVKIKHKPCLLALSTGGKDGYIYHNLIDVRFSGGKFDMFESWISSDGDVCKYDWELRFDKGSLILYRGYRMNGGYYITEEEYILYPKESDW